MTNLLNSIAQPGGGSNDNPLTLAGTSTISGTQGVSGTQNVTGSVNIKTGADITVESGGAVNIESGATETIESGAKLDIAGDIDVESGGTVTIETGGDLVVESGGTGTVNSGATLAIDGAQTVGGTVVTVTAQDLNSKTFYTTIDDISTGPTIFWIIPGVAGTITKISSVLYGAIANVDAIITAEIAATPVTDSALTIAFSGSAAGDVDSSAPSAANVITASQAVEIITNGASTNAIRVDVTIEIQLA